MEVQDVAVIGAGAAGCFCAIVCGQINPSLKIVVIEKTRQPLAKVKISGGGRCNVTHACFEPERLSSCYPRGKEFLRGNFHRFQPKDMMAWLEERGVVLKTEADGRMFPVTNRSQTIVDCFMGLLQKLNIPVLLEREVVSVEKKEGLFFLELRSGESIVSKKVMVSTGGVQRSYPLLEKFGHRMQPPIPSLFTFELEEEWIKTLAGSVAPSAIVSVEGTDFSFQGPLLVTHWGVSGPAILKLSAFAARYLHDVSYKAVLQINWTGLVKEQAVRDVLEKERRAHSGKKIALTPLFSLSKKCWKSLVVQLNPALEEKSWGRLSKEEAGALARFLTASRFSIVGKSLNKEEFVTCGGVTLDEIHPKTMESKLVSGLYMAGEVLDIDGITGGFNFQNAWTGAWMAARSMAAVEL